MAASLRESYECLGLPANASDEEVRRAYKQKARECHPDKNPDDPRATEKFQALRRSYERIVSDSNAPGEFEDDDEPFFGGFGSFFNFVIFQEMMRRKMEEAMLARMFGGIFVDDDDDDSDDDSGLPFGFFGSPFFQRPRHFESSARSQRWRFHTDTPRYERSTYEPRARGPSARPQAKEKRNPPKPARAEPRSQRNKPRTAESRHENAQKCDKKFDAESSKGKYEEKKIGKEQERQDKEEEKHNRFSKQKPRGKNPRQMTSSEWQKGRKRKYGHKKRQFPKCSSPSASKAEENQAQEPAGFDSESETSDIGYCQFPPQTQTENMTYEEHSYSSEVNHDVLD